MSLFYAHPESTPTAERVPRSRPPYLARRHTTAYDAIRGVPPPHTTGYPQTAI